MRPAQGGGGADFTFYGDILKRISTTLPRCHKRSESRCATPPVGSCVASCGAPDSQRLRLAPQPCLRTCEVLLHPVLAARGCAAQELGVDLLTERNLLRDVPLFHERANCSAAASSRQRTWKASIHSLCRGSSSSTSISARQKGTGEQYRKPRYGREPTHTHTHSGLRPAARYCSLCVWGGGG